MMDKLIITEYEGRLISVTFMGNTAISAELEDSGSTIHIGDIYQCRVRDVVKNIHSSFVEIRPGTTCFLSLEKGLSVTPGDEFPVQYARDAVKTKDAVVETDLSIAGKYCVVTSEYNLSVSSKIRDEGRKEALKALLAPICGDHAVGFVIRTNAETAEDEMILKEAEHLATVMEQLQSKADHSTAFARLYSADLAYIERIRDSRVPLAVITDDQEVYENVRDFLETDSTGHTLSLYADPMLSLVKLYRLEKVLKDATDRIVWLPSGGYLVIEPTEAMTVIDVNTGKYEGKLGKEDSVYKINCEAAIEIARQLRLRNISGIVIVDFIDMKSEKSRNQLYKLFGDTLAPDPVKVSLVDYTKLGLVELTRKKIRRSLKEQLDNVDIS